MKINSVNVLELSNMEIELLNKSYTKTVLKILASEFSLNQINELIEKLSIPTKY